MTAARLLGIRLVSLIGTSYGDPEMRGGSAEIYNLAKSGSIDGYLPLVGSLANYGGIQVVRDLLDFLPPKPTVCIGARLPGLPAVLPDAGGIESVVRHLVGVHGLKKIAYLGGNPLNPDAIRRKGDFLETMRELGLEPSEGWIASSNFTPEGGYDVFAGMIDRHGLPEAVVCANDAMALGVHRVCKERGIRIPDDLCLTGFDDIEEAGTLRPSLTTIDAMTYQIAFRSVELLNEILPGGEPRVEHVKTCLLVRRSCGCRSGGTDLQLPSILTEAAGIPTTQALREILNKPDESSRFLERLEEALDKAEHTELNLWEECLLKVARMDPANGHSGFFLEAHAIISQARHGLDQNRRFAMQLLLRDWMAAIQKLTLGMDEDDFATPFINHLQAMAPYDMRILLFNEDGSPLSDPLYGKVPFRLEIDIAARRCKIPEEDSLLRSSDSAAGSWVTLPLAMSDEHYGVVQLRDWTSNELFLDSMRHTLSMSLSLRRRSRTERVMRERFEQLSQRDELTGLLNRRGLISFGEVLLRSAARSGAKVGIFLFDMDGMKRINDTFGHADGDLAIRCLARALEDGFRQSDLVGRLGGDEFAVVGVFETGAEADVEATIRRVRLALEKRSIELARGWQVKTSVGWVLCDSNERIDLEEAFSRADTQLYVDKVQRKRGPP